MENNIDIFIKEAKMNGLTIDEIIGKAEIGRTSFFLIKSKKQVPKLDTAIKIAKALNKPVAEVFPDLR